MRKKLYFELIISFFILFILVILLTGANKYATVTKDGILLWVGVVLPAVFPYFILTTFLTNLSALTLICKKLTPLSKRLFNTGGITLYPFIISLFSGYPIGAKTVADLKEKGLISDIEGVRASVFSSFASPMFVIGSIGSIMLNNLHFGFIILLSHIISTLITGILFRFYKRKEVLSNNTNYLPNKNVDNIIYESVYSGVISLLVVGAIITLSYILCALLNDLNILNPLIFTFEKIFNDHFLAKGFVFSLIEVTGGAKIMATSSSNLLLPLLSFSISFGGLSVLLQSVAFLKKSKIKTAPFVLSKLLGAVISFIITKIILCF